MDGLKHATTQSLAWGALVLVFVSDKIMGVVVPPIPDHWYGVLIGIAIFDKNQITSVLSKIKLNMK